MVVRRILSWRVFAALAVSAILAAALFGSMPLSGAQPSSGGPTCSSQWLKDWHVWETEEEGAWLYFWWYRYCQDPSQQDDWFKVFHSWEWDSALDE